MRGGERKRPAALEQFDQLVGQHGLLDEWTSSPEGLPQRSLYSRDNNYRYAFARWWGCKEEVLRFVVWVMLNPASRESNRKRRPTLDRIVARSREWGAEGVITVNLFAYRSPDPETLADVPDPVGPHNDQVLELLTGEAWRTVAAWGARGGLHNRSTSVLPYLTNPLCLGTTRAGEPRHPLYVPAAAAVVPLSHACGS